MKRIFLWFVVFVMDAQRRGVQFPCDGSFARVLVMH